MTQPTEHRLQPDSHTTLDLQLTLASQLTVAARVAAPQTRDEALQPLISQWRPRADFSAFAAYDAGATDGLNTKGYFGAVTDGRYIYFCPVRDQQDRGSVHGRVLRYDTHGAFKDPQSWAAHDASYTDGIHSAGFYGGACDGRYVYFNPRDDGRTHHSRLLRYDTRGDFKDPQSWAAHDADFPHSGQGLAFDGRWLYFCPGYTTAPDYNPDDPGASLDNEPSGQMLRYDTAAPLKDPASYQVFDATRLSPRATCFDGALYDGRHIYYAPLSGGLVLRYATDCDYADPTSWQTFDATPLGMKMNVGLIFDGRHIYFCAYGNSHMLRYDTAAPFDDPASWVSRDAAVTDGLHTDAYNAGACDGRFIYTAPWRGDHDDGQAHGRVLRYDTLGADGAFSLRFSDFGHNGGLCAGLLGPSFTVNTTQGAVSIATHQPLAPGTHHLAGVYDGDRIKLYIDGALAAERSAPGQPLQHTAVPIDIGHIGGGSARFAGTIDEIYLANAARDAAWVAQEAAS